MTHMKTRTLFRHQQKGVDDGLPQLRDNGGVGIFFDPGLGKTVTALTMASNLLDEKLIKNVLIVCPKTLFGTWQDEIKKHTTFQPAFEIHAKDMARKDSPFNRKLPDISLSQTIIMTNFESFRRPNLPLARAFQRMEGHCLVIIDESTRIKSPSAAQTKGVHRELRDFVYKIIMTGTEITKSPLDLYSQFEFLKQGLFSQRNFFQFKRSYAIQAPVYLPGGRTVQKVVGYQRLNELQKVTAPWIVRAKKEECFDLPPKIFQDIPVELSKKEWKAYKDMRDHLMTVLDSGEIISVTQKVALFTRFRTLTGGWATTDQKIEERPSKLAALSDMVSDDNEQAIIWCAFRHEIDMMKKEFKDECVTYYGEDSQEARQGNLERFLAGKVRFFVANAKTAGWGLNLQHCRLQYFYSLPTSAEEYMQSLDRSHRIGSRSEVVYRMLLARYKGVDCIDWRIKALLDQSVDLLHAFQTRSLSELVQLI